MLSFWRRNRRFIVFSLVLVILIGFASHMASQRDNISRLEKFFTGALTPLLKASSVVWQKVADFIGDLGSLLTLRAKNYEMEAELSALKMRVNALIELERENQRLRALLDYKETNPDYMLRLAKIISVSKNSWQHELVIDLGSNHGVSLNMPVITAKGFVGRVYEVSSNNAKVVLITDPRGPIAVQVQETRVRGTLEADQTKPGLLRLIRLPRDADVQPGHAIITAGTGAWNLPQGILVGYVQATAPTADGLQLEASVVPAVNFDALDEVLLVVDVEEE